MGNGVGGSNFNCRKADIGRAGGERRRGVAYGYNWGVGVEGGGGIGYRAEHWTW